MSLKRQLDADSTGSPLSKRLRIAQPILQKCEALFEEGGMTPRTFGPLGILGLLLEGQSQEEDELPQDEDKLLHDKETDPDEYVSKSMNSYHAYKFSEVSETILQDRLGFRFASYDWTPRGFLCNPSRSKHYADDLEPLYNELEIIYSTSEPKNLGAAARQVTNAYLSFVFTTIRKEREIDMKNAIKARLEADPGLDVTTLSQAHLDAEEIYSAYLESAEGAGLPSTVSELSVNDKVNYILWCNRYVHPNRLLGTGDIKNTPHIRLYQEIIIDSDDNDASYRDRNGQEITLSGVVEYAMLVFKTEDEEQVLNAGYGTSQKCLHKVRSLEPRLLFLETRERDLRDEPLIEASAQALALSRLFKRPNVRFIVTDSNDWMVAHLHNPLDGGSPEVTSWLLPPLYSEIPFQAYYGTILGRVGATKIWRIYVRTFYVTLLEWLLPESTSAIPTPPRFDKMSGSKI